MNTMKMILILLMCILINGVLGAQTTDPSITVLENGNIGIHNPAPDNDLDIKGKTVITGDLEVTGEIILNGETTLKQPLVIINNAAITGDLSVDTNLIITNDALIGNNLNVDGKLTAKKDVEINGALTVDKKLTANLGVEVTGTTTLNDEVTINDNAAITGTLTVDKKLTANLGAEVTGNLDVTGELSVTDNTGTMTGYPIPAGGIIMWSGTHLDIPDGWSLCDGTNGTPDLRGRFILSADPNNLDPTKIYQPGQYGGTETATLAIDNMPAHDHNGTLTTKEGGKHTHSGSTGNNEGSHNHNIIDKEHSHKLPEDEKGNSNKHTVKVEDTWKSDEGYGSGKTSSAYSGVEIKKDEGTHTHNLTITDSPTHDHTVTIPSQGNGTAFSIMPPYYVLAFIMKL